MISILIPVFNRNVVSLVAALHSQIIAVKEQVEIVVMDDASSDEAAKNTNRRGLASFSHLNYIELPVNTGRNIIRHKLAEAAKYNTFIFLDADSDFVDALWLQRYISAIAGDAIIMGGRSYRKETQQNSLHLHYGTHREQHKATIRNSNPYRSFLACNFLINRKQLASLVIDTNLHGYCHEDTFMGLQFEKLNVPVLHIDNPVYHEGIDADNVFIEKQYEALENLNYLYAKYGRTYNFIKNVKLIRAYQKLKNSPVKFILNKMGEGEEGFRKRALKSYSLFWLDCWKLAAYHSIANR